MRAVFVLSSCAPAPCEEEEEEEEEEIDIPHAHTHLEMMTTECIQGSQVLFLRGPLVPCLIALLPFFHVVDFPSSVVAPCTAILLLL